MLSQFTREGNNRALCDLNFSFAKDVYPLGRLDSDSEGLLILTNNKRLNNLLLDPTKQHKRTYFVQVEGMVTDDQINQLSSGVEISINGQKHKTKPALVKLIKDPVFLPERNPPIRFRKNIPTSWISITLTEGKNRQVRRMTAKVGIPTLRLVRYSIEKMNIEGFLSGQVDEIDGVELGKNLGINIE